MKMKSMLVALAVVVGPVAGAHASLSVTIDSSHGTNLLSTTFEAVDYQRTLYAVCGDKDMGDDISKWPYRETLVEIPTGDTAVTSLPLPISVNAGRLKGFAIFFRQGKE